MEAAPPSYARATQINCWHIIARYIPSDDLCSAALVNRAWHSIFAPHLWGNPASHFGIEDDAVYVALTRFKRTLQTARLLVRSLTHTLHLPPAHPELYNGPHADWLRDILDRLPNLQSLIVRGLPFFDHSALQALRYTPPKATQTRPLDGLVELPGSPASAAFATLDFTPSFGLRLLDASRCLNVTSGSLAQALKRFDSLLYLDLSFTLPARDETVMRTLYRCHGLQVLKLRGIHLNDYDLGILGPSIAHRVRSLDIRDNQITDRGVRILLEESFVYESSSHNSGRRSPALLPYIGSEVLEIYQGENFESYLRNMFTTSFVGRLAMEDIPEGGITHLYISNNRLSAEGLSALIRSERLHVLDVDAVITDLGKDSSMNSHVVADGDLSLPGVEKLTPLMYRHGSASLTFLRIHHHIVIKDSPKTHSDEEMTGRAELDGFDAHIPANETVEIDGTAVPAYVELSADAVPRYELAASPTDVISAQPGIAELPADSTARHDLPANLVDVIVTPNTDQSAPPLAEDPGSSRWNRRDSTCAPEPVGNLPADLESLGVVSPLGEEGSIAMKKVASIPTPSLSVPEAWSSSQAEASNFGVRPRSYSSVAHERTIRLHTHISRKSTLHPAMLPHLDTLILTNIPPFTPSRDLSNCLIVFIKQCAEEAFLAKTQARLDYALPPGRRGHAGALRYSAKKVFALSRLVLEMAPESVRRKSVGNPWQQTNAKSVTQDRDSESLWSAAETDFSFFGEEEVILPTLEYGRFASGATSKQAGPSNVQQHASQIAKVDDEPKFDTVALLSAFRRERKAAHMKSLSAGAGAQQIEGYWEGIIQIVRPWSSDLRKDEEIDYYGNRFHKN